MTSSAKPPASPDRDPRPAELPTPWGPLLLPPDRPRSASFHSLDLTAIQTEGEIRVLSKPLDPHRTTEPDPPELARDSVEVGGKLDDAGEKAPRPDPDPGWSRWAVPSSEGALWLRPCLPDRALVLEPEAPFVLLPGAKARVFVRVPLWVRVEWMASLPDPSVLPPPGIVLAEHPISTLSDTWWGDPMEGELAYWLPTRARRVYRPELREIHLAICPLVLENQAATELRVEKLSFKSVHLSVFSDAAGFWGDESRVRYEGESEGSAVEVSGKPPAEAGSPTRITQPRSPIVRGIRARTFHRLREISSLGGST